MSDRKNITQFELLPNEILIECFEYLNACDLFHSFDQLNDRFNHLIRHIRLYLNFENVNKSIFDEFCTKMLLNPQMKNQVYSLYFPFDDKGLQERIFSSLFSHEEFPNLEKYGLVLPSITPLNFSLPSGPNANFSIKPTDTLLSKLRALSIVELHLFMEYYILSSSSITNLTVDQCDLEYFCYFLRHLPKLKYFHIQRIHYRDYENEEEPSNFHSNYYLKQLIIDDFIGTFNNFKMYVVDTPYLQSLTICSMGDKDLIDAHRWEQLITTSLPSLTTFKFIFYYRYRNNEDNLIDIFNQFRTEFWQKHRWFTEYVIADDLSFIYTIPYLSNTFQLPLESKRYCNDSRNNVDTFTNVTNLILYQEMPTKTLEYYFPNVTSFRLIEFSDESLRTKSIKYLNKLVNLFHLKHLDIRGMFDMNSTAILLEFLKTTPQLNSFAMHEDEVASLLNDEELCNYLNKVIKRLYIYQNPDNSINNCRYPTEQFSKTFGNIEHLLYEIGYKEELVFSLNHFPKLSTLHIKWSPYDDPSEYLFQLKNEVRKLNLIADINVELIDDWGCISYYNYRSDDRIDGMLYYTCRKILGVNLCMWLPMSSKSGKNRRFNRDLAPD